MGFEINGVPDKAPGERSDTDQLTGPVIYCPRCRHRTGVYKPRAGAPEVPKPGAMCGGCRNRAKGRTKKRPPGMVYAPANSSPHTVSGGLPTLGKRSK